MSLSEDGGGRPRASVLTGALVLVAVMWTLAFVGFSLAEDLLAWDVRFAYLPAAEAVLDGRSPYPELDDPILEDQKGYVYPPQLVVALIPFTPLPIDVVAVLVTFALLALVALTLWILDVRDLRCYAAAFLWMPTTSGVLLGNVSIPLAFALAVAWRYRETLWRPALAVGLAVSAKLLLWPVFVWMVATRRLRAAALSALIGAVVTFAAWAAIGFDGLRLPGPARAPLRDPGGAELLDRRDGGDPRSRLDRGQRPDSRRWTSLLVGCVVFARRSDDAALVHVRRRGDARGEPDRVAPLPRGPPRSDGDPSASLLGALAAPDPVLGEPAAGLCRGSPDVPAGARRGDTRRRPARAAAPARGSCLRLRRREHRGRAAAIRLIGAWSCRGSCSSAAASCSSRDALCRIRIRAARLGLPVLLPPGCGVGCQRRLALSRLAFHRRNRARGLRLSAAACVRSRTLHAGVSGRRVGARGGRCARRAAGSALDRRRACRPLCFAALLLWAPAWNALEMANVSALLALGIALAWRFRSTKWPLAGCSASPSRRSYSCGRCSCGRRRPAASAQRRSPSGSGPSVDVLSWAVIGFAGLTEYPDLGRRFSELQAETSFSMVGIASVLGVGDTVGRLATLVVGVLLLARHASEQAGALRIGAFTYAIGGALVLSSPSSGCTTSWCLRSRSQSRVRASRCSGFCRSFSG